MPIAAVRHNATSTRLTNDVEDDLANQATTIATPKPPKTPTANEGR